VGARNTLAVPYRPTEFELCYLRNNFAILYGETTDLETFPQVSSRNLEEVEEEL